MSREIGDSPEFRRIVELPRRAPELTTELVTELTSLLKTPEGTMALKPVQALALYEIGTYKGLFGPIRVGGGKTLISLLAPYVLELQRPILLLPAALIEKTERERRQLAKHWRVARNLRFISYESLGLEKSADILKMYRPDGIIADEAHLLKNKKAGRTRRVLRYMKESPETCFIAISGTMMKASLRDFAHILTWTHGKGAPIPTNEGDLEFWASCLDESKNPFGRTQPGALLKQATMEDQGEDDFATARRWFRRRLLETPGVVATQGDQVSCSLYVRALEFNPSSVTDDNFSTLRSLWETPDGWALSQAVDVWRVARELALGLHYVWDPRPPPEWLTARREWAAFVRDVLSRSRTLDTELQVANACRLGDLDRDAFDAWQEIKDEFKINSKPVWHDVTALETCERWMAKGPGIVWVEHGFFGRELEKRTGVPYCREGGLDKNGIAIESHDPKRPLIASIRANGTGRNLQAWCRNLITSCPTGNSELEQTLGRTHRDGQKADAVEVDILLGCLEHATAWETARARARATEDTLGQPQKILLADSLFPSVDSLAGRSGPRWTKVAAKAKNPSGDL